MLCACVVPANARTIAIRIMNVFVIVRPRLRAPRFGAASLPLLRHPRDRNAELTRLSVQVRPLDPESLGGIGHAPPMMLQDRGDVLAFEPQARFTQTSGRNEGR